MNDLQLVKSTKFGEVQADIYSNGNEMFMTANQLCECLGENRSTFDKRLSRNPKLKTSEFSVSDKMSGTDGKLYNTRVFNEDGIYEITLLSESEKGEEFRSWVRSILRTIRKTGTYSIHDTDKVKNLEIKEMNAKVRMSNQFLKLSNVDTLSKEYKNILVAKATEVLTGEQLLPLPKSAQKTYSATELGEMFGVTAQKIGGITNKYSLKTEEYGEYYRSKSQYSSKEVDTFVYYDSVIPILEGILGKIAV